MRLILMTGPEVERTMAHGAMICGSDEPGRDVLIHYRTKGSKNGVRLYQDKSGRLTPEGYKHYAEMYGWGSKSRNRYDSDLEAEVNELQVMERVDAINSRKNTTAKEKKFVSRIVKGEALSASERSEYQKLGEKYYQDNFKLDKKRIDILKKNDAWSNIKDESEFPEVDRKKLAEIQKKMLDNRKGYADASYMLGLAREAQYWKDVEKETDPDYIDPSYRNFSSKEEKAAAEAAYVERIWLTDDESKMGDKWKRELGHLTNRVWTLSCDGYEGLPKSERIRAMYDYVDTPNSFDRYENWRPKYEATSEWKTLQKELNNVRKMPRSTDAEIKAYYKKVHEIEAKEKPIKDKFYAKVAENVLLDLGWEVTPKNIELIGTILWWD